jgi:flagellar basal body-associated protein FliL
MMKIVLIAVGVLLGIVMLAGDGLAAWLFLTRQGDAQQPAAAKAITPAAKPPGPLHFAELEKFVVSLATASESGGHSYAQVNLSFSSYNEDAVKAFDDVRPMIKAAVVSSIMAHADKVATGSTEAREMIIAEALAAANSIVAQQDPKMGQRPFAGAFLTDFVLQ